MLKALPVADWYPVAVAASVYPVAALLSVLPANVAIPLDVLADTVPVREPLPGFAPSAKVTVVDVAVVTVAPLAFWRAT